MKHVNKTMTLLCLIIVGLSGCNDTDSPVVIEKPMLDPILVAQGKDIFRFDTFGDEQLWTDTLQLHNVVAGAVDPVTALSVGLKVDSEVLPAGVLQTVDLTDPATTITLLKLNAVVGLQGDVQEINGKDTLVSLGVTCALCHSTVDDSVAPGIGKRLDGWANRDLNPGVILSLSPALQDQTTQDVLLSWGAGKYDAYWNQDGLNDPTVIPPAYGLKDVALATYTGEGDVPYWNAYVGVTQMGAQGNFVDERLGLDIIHSPDLLTEKLPALEAYQFSLNAPKAPEGSFDSEAATRGKVVFNYQGNCSACHSGDNFTDADTTLHYPDAVGTDPMLASRSTTGKYRTTPLASVWQHPPYFHDGSAATLLDVVEHYNNHLALGLMPSEKDDLVQYLLSL
ncbi:MAG: hypothetical protein QNK36_07220 [Colwellia sp.]|nr:hypothetical protein [Colwellia sp.]